MPLRKHKMHYCTREQETHVVASSAYSTAESVLRFWSDLYVQLNVTSRFIARRLQPIVRFWPTCKIEAPFKHKPIHCCSNIIVVKERKCRNGLIIYTHIYIYTDLFVFLWYTKRAFCSSDYIASRNMIVVKINWEWVWKETVAALIWGSLSVFTWLKSDKTFRILSQDSRRIIG